MKLPNDLIKATDYSKAKDREIHEFEYRNGEYIHKYVLDGEHELTPQEVVDCLNGLATIDCDLQTAYAYIEDCQKQIEQLKQQLAEKDRAIENWETMYKSVVQTCHNDAKEISRLREQLEKKDDEILKGDCAFVKEVYNSEQDKISFALKKLKETQIYVDNQHFMNARYKCEKKVYADIWNFIDNQIRQLKEMK